MTFFVYYCFICGALSIANMSVQTPETKKYAAQGHESLLQSGV